MKKISINIVKYIVFITITIVVFLPILITLFASLKDAGQISTISPLLPPALKDITFENYKKVFSEGMLGVSFFNSFFLVSVSVIINVLIGSITAYTLERFNFRFKAFVYALFLLGMLVPSNVTEIARFQVVSSLGLYNTLAAPMVIYACSDLMQLYIYRQFINQIPVSLDESARLDGCGYFRTYIQIIFPLLLPATATLSIIKAVDIINDMYIPYLYMPSEKLKTLTTMLMSYSGALKGAWQTLAACVIVVMIPTLLLYLVFTKYIFAGIVSGAVKE
jgi:ABC-type sugar transport system, permease component